jgi:acyl-coenzyme A synthetase/AMP-(fatty) acid ligase
MLRPTVMHAQNAARYRRGGHWSAIPLGERFAANCARSGYATALIDGEQRLSFAEWERLAQRAALGLLALGVAPGDVVAYQLPNWWEAAVMFLAAARIGAVVNPVLPLFRARELSFILRQSGASVLIIPGHFRGCDYPELIGGLRADLPALREVLVVRGEAPAPLRSFDAFLATPWERAPQTADRVVTSVAADALLMLMYTSGTTGDPKGVLYSHRSNVLHGLAVNMSDCVGAKSTDSFMPVVPMVLVSALLMFVVSLITTKPKQSTLARYFRG